jgi:ketosteroid isomerase-like protein
MSAEDIVRRLFDATTRRDFATARDAYEDVVLVVDTDVIPTAAGTFRGREAVGEWFADWFRSFAEDYRFDVEEIESVGEQVFAVASHYGRGRASGVELGFSVAYVCTVRAAKIVRLEMYRDRDKALEAVGLAE